MAFNETVIRMAMQSSNGGPLEGATHTGVAGTPGAGKYIKVHLRVEDGTVKEAKWEANGCPASMACAATVCKIACGKTFTDLMEISHTLSRKDVIVLLQGLPEGKEPMADMAVEALREALRG